MNLKNLEYIKSGLRELGFGDKLLPDLEKGMGNNHARCTFLSRARIGDQEIVSSIHLVKSAQSDNYRITKYDAMIKKEPSVYDNTVHTFYINKNKGVTLKEAFNLLEGRSVQKPFIRKDGTMENTWMQLDLKKEDRVGNLVVNKYGASHGFDLQKSLAELPIMEMKRASAKETLIRSLQKGNLEQVTIIRAGSQEKGFIEASPQSKAIIIYDAKMQKVEKESLLASQAVDQTKQEIKNNQSGKLGVKPKNELASSNMRDTRSRRKGLSH